MGKLKDLYYKVTKQNTVEDKLRRGDITYDEAMDWAAGNFVLGALLYYEGRIDKKRAIKKYNEKVPNIEEAIQELLDGTAESESFNLLYIKTFEKDYRDSIWYIRTGAIMAFTSAYGALKGMEVYNTFAGKQPDERAFIADIKKRCMKPEVMEKAKAENKVPLLGEDFYPTESQLHRFYLCTRVFERAVERCGSFDDVDCFNEKGLLINEDGDLLEEDIFKDYIHVDYKGLV